MLNNSAKTKWIVLVIILLLVLAAGVGIYCWQSKYSVDETADWKTYTNEKYGFSLKYPTDWSYREEQEVVNADQAVSFTDAEGKETMRIVTLKKPAPDIGSEGSEIIKKEKVKIQDSDKYFTKRLLNT
jgi:hypothetical protein